jgi:chondroitin-sulfate-ABC endolyase/exolyase
MEKMKANVLNVDEKSGYEEMLLSDEWFAGGVTHRGQSGAFAMKLHEHDKYNGSLRARKSFFTFENRVICLGSDIENSLEGAPVHTTLLQHYTGGFEMSASYVSEDRKIIRDNLWDVYFIKDGNVRYSHELQHSLHEETDAPTEGIFEKAYIDHGDVITDGRYEYMLLMSNKDNYKMLLDTLAIKEYAKNLPYKVIRHDRSVHGVEDLPSGTRAYAVFEKDRVDSLVTDCSPAMLMYTTDGKTMTLSVSNPDLALYEGPSDEVYDENGKRKERSVYSRSWIDNPCGETTVTLTIDGVWAIADRNGCNVRADYRQGATTLTFRSTEARTEEIKLKKTRL